jgi:arylsulfatase A-like enzyme
MVAKVRNRILNTKIDVKTFDKIIAGWLSEQDISCRERISLNKRRSNRAMKSAIMFQKLLCFLTIFIVSSVFSAEKPNILLILADDLGWSDTSVTGSKYYRTPNLERLAKRGVRFTNAYSASPLCSPTRCSIMTGQSPARTGFTTPGGHLVQVILKASVNKGAKATERQIACTSITRMDTDHLTLAEALKEGGYVTGHFGKWHLGREPYSPLEHGFNVDVPHWPGPGPAGSFVAPWKFPDFKEKYSKEHLEDRMGDEAVAFMEAHTRLTPGQVRKPFFLNYWQFSVHAPFDAKAELIEKYKKLRDPHNPQQSPTYAAMIQSLDDNIGKMLDALDRLGISDNTIILFYSDNGGNMYNLVDGGTATSNAPLRGGKASIYEGGIRIPAIVSWPGVTRGGTISKALVQSEDLYPTILEMATLPAHPEQALDAVSMVPALKGEQGLRSAVYSYFPHAPAVPEWLPPSACVRVGDWKLIRIFHDAEGGGHRYELYNLADDIGERHNLAFSQPERVESMDAMIEKFLVDTHAVRPVPNPGYNPAAVDHLLGWRSGGDARLSFGHKLFQIRSFGKNPSRVRDKPLELVKGKYSFELRMRSWAGGPVRLFWAGADGKFTDRLSLSLSMAADGLWHELQTQLAFDDTVQTLRFDPADSEGSVNIEWIRLRSLDGKVVKEWDFTVKPKPVRAKIKVVPQIAIGGWKGGHNSHLALRQGKGVLHIQSKGRDPMLISEALALSAGSYTLKIRMKSRSRGNGLLFARPAKGGYKVGSGTSFSFSHDNKWHIITIPLNRNYEIAELRLDPCTAPGEIEIEWINLSLAEGDVIQEWNFL